MSIDRFHEMDRATAVERLQGVIEQRDADLAEKLAVKTRENRRARIGVLVFAGLSLLQCWHADVLLGRLFHEREQLEYYEPLAVQAIKNTADQMRIADDCRASLGDVTKQLDTSTLQTADAIMQRDTAVELVDEAMAAWRTCRRGR